MNPISINNIKIGNNYPPFIIAEAGINHNGEIEKAFEMIDVAKRAGANAVKFQTFKAEEFVADPNQTFTYKSQGREITESMLDMFRRYEFSRDEWFLIKKKCDETEIMFLSTPQNRSDLDLLLELDISAIKVGSDDFTNLPLLESYAETKLPMILSCGMSDLAEVYQALETVGTLDGYPTILLLCTSQYPTTPEDVNLLKLETLANTFPMVVTGFSDHTQGPLASSLAVAMGAHLFEKHFTLNHNLPGPDHWFSEDPKGLKEWANSIHIAYTMMGSDIVRPTSTERDNKKEFQRVIVSLIDIQPGNIFTPENIGMRRVAGGNGFPPRFFDNFLGKKASRVFQAGEPIDI